MAENCEGLSNNPYTELLINSGNDGLLSADEQQMLHDLREEIGQECAKSVEALTIEIIATNEIGIILFEGNLKNGKMNEALHVATDILKYPKLTDESRDIWKARINTLLAIRYSEK